MCRPSAGTGALRAPQRPFRPVLSIFVTEPWTLRLIYIDAFKMPYNETLIHLFPIIIVIQRITSKGAEWSVPDVHFGQCTMVIMQFDQLHANHYRIQSSDKG